MTLSVLAACSRSPEIVEVPKVEVVETEVRPPAPIVPPIDQVTMRSVDWIIVTPENIEEVFANLKGDKVLFALTSDGYENIALNLSDIRKVVQQQQEIIVIYKRQFSR